MSFLRLFTDFDGRIGRMAFWFGSVAVTIVLLSIQRLAPMLLDRVPAAQVFAFCSAFALFPWAALAAKRATDRGSVPLFGILLVCAIVLPGQLKPLLSIAWRPALDTIVLLALAVALVDLGLMPAPREGDEVADRRADAKAAPWIQNHPQSSASTPPTP